MKTVQIINTMANPKNIPFAEKECTDWNEFSFFLFNHVSLETIGENRDLEKTFKNNEEIFNPSTGTKVIIK